MNMFKNLFRRKDTEGTFDRLTENSPEGIGSQNYISKIPLDTLLPDAYQGLTILIVDDNEDQLHIMAHFLKKHGADVDLAPDGLKGIELFLTRPDPYNLILMDIQMPGIDGNQAAGRIRKSGVKNAETIPIAALSGNSSFNQSEDTNFTTFLDKPFELEQLAYIIEHFCRN